MTLPRTCRSLDQLLQCTCREFQLFWPGALPFGARRLFVNNNFPAIKHFTIQSVAVDDYLPASLLWGSFCALLPLFGLRNCSRDVFEPALCHNVDPPCGRVLGLDISELWVHTESHIAGQGPTSNHAILRLPQKSPEYLEGLKTLLTGKSLWMPCRLAGFCVRSVNRDCSG